MSAVLSEALEHTSVVTPPEDGVIERLSTQYAGLYGVEEGARSEMSRQLAIATRNREMTGKTEIDPVILKWRWSEMLRTGWRTPDIPLPKICPLTLESNVFEISDSVWGMSTWKDFPQVVQSSYRDVESALNTTARTKIESFSIRFSWEGVIPAEAKQVIADNRDEFEQVFLLTETPAKSWTLKRTPVPEMVDPLIVGTKYNAMYLLGKFDPTPLEEYIASEFAR